MARKHEVEGRVGGIEVPIWIFKRRKLNLWMKSEFQDEILTPKTSLLQLKQHSDILHTFSDWLESIHRSKEKNKDHESREGMIPILQQFEEVVSDLNEERFENVNLDANNDDPVLNVQLNENENQPLVKIDVTDIQDEVDLWVSSIVCYVLSANPPIQVMDGFFRRI